MESSKATSNQGHHGQLEATALDFAETGLLSPALGSGRVEPGSHKAGHDQKVTERIITAKELLPTDLYLLSTGQGDQISLGQEWMS